MPSDRVRRRRREIDAYCSFCGKSQHEVRKLIAGPNVFICNECVELCADIIKEEDRKNRKAAGPAVMTPSEIKGCWTTT